MLVLIIMAVVMLGLGLLFLGGEDSLKKLDKIMNKTIMKIGSGSLSKKNEKLLGLFLIAFSIVLFVISFHLKH